MHIGESSKSTLEVKEKVGGWQQVKGHHLDVHDAQAAGVNLILGGVDEVRITTIVELQAVGRRRRKKG